LAHLLVQCFVATCAPLFKSSAAAAIGGMDENMWFLGDWDYWLRLAAVGVTAYHPGVLSSFRVHSESQTIARNGVAEDIRQQYATVFERHRASFQDQPKAVRLAATLSMEVNLALAAAVAGKLPCWRPLASSFFRAGLQGGWKFLRDSRVVERCSSRVRAGLAKSRNQELIDHPGVARPRRRRLRRRAQMLGP
jgi:hypothetical protein